MSRKETAAAETLRLVKECHVALYGGEKDGKPVKSLILRTEAIEEKVFPPVWKALLKEGRIFVQAVAASVGIHKGIG